MKIEFESAKTTYYYRNVGAYEAGEVDYQLRRTGLSSWEQLIEEVWEPIKDCIDLERQHQFLQAKLNRGLDD
ncbi:MAG: hypothetical protein HC824_14275 [Synechococcales cyanobacterium RM1_1_8]|nr:hypothetical protein [Synechococcales cyanobacterium RM1_1_8]